MWKTLKNAIIAAPDGFDIIVDIDGDITTLNGVVQPSKSQFAYIDAETIARVRKHPLSLESFVNELSVKLQEEQQKEHDARAIPDIPGTKILMVDVPMLYTEQEAATIAGGYARDLNWEAKVEPHGRHFFIRLVPR